MKLLISGIFPAVFGSNLFHPFPGLIRLPIAQLFPPPAPHWVWGDDRETDLDRLALYPRYRCCRVTGHGVMGPMEIGSPYKPMKMSEKLG